MKRGLVVVVVVVLALALGGYWFFGHRQSAAAATQYLTSTVRQGDVTSSIASTGTIGAASTYSLAFGTTTESTTSTTSAQSSSSSSNAAGSSSSSTVATVNVTVGQHVRKGAVLATEDTAGSSADVASAKASLASAQAQVEVAQAQLTSARAKISSQVSTSSQVASAKAQLQADQAQLAVDQSAVSSAAAKLATDLAASPAAPGSVISQDRLTLAQAQARVAQDKAKIASDKQAISTASDTSATDASNAASLAQARASVTQAQNQVTSAQAALTTARTAAASTTITAPVAGVVTAVNLTEGQAPPSSGAITLRSDALTVTANVAEQDVANLAVGQTAKVTITALNVTVPATVTALPTAANPSSAGSGAVTFPLELALTTTPKGTLPGMSASISIATASAVNVLYVPTTAIQGTSPDNTVQVMTDGAPVSTPVNIGLSTNSSTEIISGIQVGQVVVTGVVNPTASTSTTGGVGGLTGGTRTGFPGGTGLPGGARPGG